MNRFAPVSAGFAAVLALALPATHARAATTTWVAWAGQDINNFSCDRGSPCRTFQHAHDVADNGGTINCIEASHYGFVTITKSITIDCTGALARSSGIVVNGPGSSVTLRGLSIDGAGTGAVGVDFSNGGALRIESCRISGFRNSVAGIGVGIRFVPPAGGAGKLSVADSMISDNGLPSNTFIGSLGSGGIIVESTGSGSARVVFDRVRVENNTNGILAIGSGSTGLVAVQVRDSVAANNDFNGISALTFGSTAPVSVIVDHSSSTLNGASGILAQGSLAFVRLGNSTVTSNPAGLNAILGGRILSYQDNRITDNVTDGAPTNLLTAK
jgi:hypothetical protein